MNIDRFAFRKYKLYKIKSLRIRLDTDGEPCPGKCFDTDEKKKTKSS